MSTKVYKRHLEYIPAPAVSPDLEGIPTAPTAAPETNNTQVATTAYVDAVATVAGGVYSS